MCLKKGEEAIGRCHKFILSAGRVVWQLETWLDAEMRSVTFFDCHTGWDGWILEHIPGSWDIHVVKCWSLWSNLTCHLWVAGFCQPCRCCCVCANAIGVIPSARPCIRPHPASHCFLGNWWTVSHSTCANWVIFTHANVLVTWGLVLVHSVRGMHVNGRNPRQSLPKTQIASNLLNRNS